MRCYSKWIRSMCMGTLGLAIATHRGSGGSRLARPSLARQAHDKRAVGARRSLPLSAVRVGVGFRVSAASQWQWTLAAVLQPSRGSSSSSRKVQSTVGAFALLDHRFGTVCSCSAAGLSSAPSRHGDVGVNKLPSAALVDCCDHGSSHPPSSHCRRAAVLARAGICREQQSERRGVRVRHVLVQTQ